MEELMMRRSKRRKRIRKWKNLKGSNEIRKEEVNDRPTRFDTAQVIFKMVYEYEKLPKHFK